MSLWRPLKSLVKGKSGRMVVVFLGGTSWRSLSELGSCVPVRVVLDVADVLFPFFCGD